MPVMHCRKRLAVCTAPPMGNHPYYAYIQPAQNQVPSGPIPQPKKYSRVSVPVLVRNFSSTMRDKYSRTCQRIYHFHQVAARNIMKLVYVIDCKAAVWVLCRINQHAHCKIGKLGKTHFKSLAKIHYTNSKLVDQACSINFKGENRLQFNIDLI